MKLNRELSLLCRLEVKHCVLDYSFGCLTSETSEKYNNMVVKDKQEKELRYSREFEVRFSEVDIMGVVWHGSYPLYLEDAREAWGHHYGLCYDDYLKNDVFAPIVDMDIRYHRPIFYSTKPRIDIAYQFSPAAKIIFDYEIHDTADNALLTSARTIQAFTDKNYELILENPDFYLRWKRSMFNIE